MAAAETRQKVLLGILAVLAVAFAVVQGTRQDEGAAPAAGGRASATQAPPAARPSAPAAPRPAVPEVPAVRLDVLRAERPPLEEAERDPFRFRPKPPPVPQWPGSAAGSRPDPNAPPPSPPPPPPIPLKFIGLVDAPGQGAKVAVLSDGRNVFYGREGDIIEGRYQVLRIGADSAELAYVDGRGRQVIRLSGQ